MNGVAGTFHKATFNMIDANTQDLTTQDVAFRQVLLDIVLGKHDKDLSQFIEMAVNRAKSIGMPMPPSIVPTPKAGGFDRAKFNSLHVGDAIRFNNGVRPSYLVGVTGKVVDKKQKRIVVRLDVPMGRFNGNIRTHLEIIDKI